MKIKHLITYAQNREDVILSGFFKNRKTGFYVDVGAGDPVIDNVTKLFYDRGWQGINVEPIKHIHQQIKQARSRDINLNLGVSNKQGVLQFREYVCDGYSTFSEDMKQQYSRKPDEFTSEYNDYEVETVPLSQLLLRHKVKGIQFLKVDVEGYEYEVLEGNDWSKYRPEVICIEANHINKDWRPLLKRQAYEFAFFDGLNEYYQDSKMASRAVFSYVDTVIANEPIVNYQLLEEFKDYDKKIKKLESLTALQRDHIHDLDAAAANLQAKIDEITPLGRHIKLQLGSKLKRSPKK